MFAYDHDTKTLNGINLPSFYHPNLTTGEVIVHYLLREPGRLVQANFDDGVDLSAGEMAKLGTRVAKNLYKTGLNVGDVVGLVVRNTNYVAPVVLGCLLSGTPCSTLDPTFDAQEIANIFRQTRPKLVFCDHDNWETVTEALATCENDCEVITVDERLEEARFVTEMFELGEGEREFIPHGFGIEASKLCGVILCSSGTTALSKGTMLSHAQCISMTKAFPQILNPTVICFSSLYWLSGFTSLMNALANNSKRIITRRPFSPLLMVHLIEKYKVNVMVTPPSQVAMLLQSPILKLANLSSVRMQLVVGGFLAPSLRKAMQEHLLYGALLMTYGMTETGTLIAMTMPFQRPSDSVGKIAPNMRMKVVDDDGNVLEPGEVGEIHLFPQFKFLGYASNAEESKNAVDSDGWLKTGDLGFFTDDGEITLVDRKKEMIKYLNYQVAPSELESRIQQMEGVNAVCVVGVPDMISGDLAAAVIVKEQNSNLTEQDVIDEIARNFPLFKRLHGGAYFVDELPLTPSGKIKKRLVKTQAARMYKSQEINGNY